VNGVTEHRNVGSIVAYWLGPALFLLMTFVELPGITTADGSIARASETATLVLGLALWMAVWWITEALPLAATSLLPLVVLPLSGVMGADAAATQYFDDVVALFLGGFCLALAMERTGLHRQIAGVALRVFGVRPRRVVLGLLVSSAITSMWVSNTATALALLPVALTLAGVSAGTAVAGPRDERGRFASACVLAVAFGASLGGIGTLIGTPPNAILQAQYSSKFSAEIDAGTLPELTFGTWMLIGVPLVMVLVPACWAILVWISPGVSKTLPHGDVERLTSALKTREPFTKAQMIVLVVFVATALLWVTRATIVVGDVTVPLTGWGSWFVPKVGAKSFATDGMVAILAAVALFALPMPERRGERLLSWEFAVGKLPWGALLLFGGGLALAKGFSVSGLDSYLTASFGTMSAAPVLVLMLVVVAGMTLFSEIASNTAAAALAVPLLGSLAVAAGLGPLGLMAAGALGASCGYALPAATPPNTVAIATGAVRTKEMVKSGLWLDVVAIVAVTITVTWLLPLALG